ncbi:MAG: repressor LexA [Planctomycetaceae bacterium]
MTKRQREIYEFLKDRIQNRGFGPTVREIGDHFGIKSPNGVMCHLKALEKKGLITRESNMSRAICLCQDSNASCSIAHIGTAVTGSPVKAAVSSDERVQFEDVFRGEDKACITVLGDCFNALCILDGDTIIVSRTAQGQTGNLVAALDEHHRVTIYRIQAGGRVPVPGVPGSYAGPARQILGTVVAVVRQFPSAPCGVPPIMEIEDESDPDEPNGVNCRFAEPAFA